jgi:hypothetical protein
VTHPREPVGEQEEKALKKKKPCKHYWLYPHGIIEGRQRFRRNEVAVVRYCGDCGYRQVAYASLWRKASGAYARDEHYEAPRA